MCLDWFIPAGALGSKWKMSRYENWVNLSQSGNFRQLRVTNNEISDDKGKNDLV